MITITLTGQDAIDYINRKTVQDEPKQVTPTTIDNPTPFDEPAIDIDSAWREHVDTEVPTSRANSRITQDELDIIHNAAGKTDHSYYSIQAIAKGTGRTTAAITSQAIRLGYCTKKGLILRKNV